MAYADQQMSGNKVTAFIVVLILHILVGYALVTGLAYEAVKKIREKVTTVDIKEEVKKEEPPPPPPKKAEVAPPPIVAPPPRINVAPAAPVVETVREAPPPPPVAPVIAAPAAPPAPRFAPKGATPKGRGQGSWVTTADYPSRAQAEEREGVTRYRLSISADGKVADCQVTGSSGSPDLDDAACRNIVRRARFNPATDGEGQPTTGSYTGSVRWQLPQD